MEVVERPVETLVKLGTDGAKPGGQVAMATRLLIPAGARVRLICELPQAVRCWTGDLASPMEKGCLVVGQGRPTTLCPAERMSLNVGDEFARKGVRFELENPHAFVERGFLYD